MRAGAKSHFLHGLIISAGNIYILRILFHAMIAEFGIAAIAAVTSVWLIGHTAVSIAKAKAEVEVDLKLRREAQNNEFKLERIKAETAAMRADADITAFAANAGQAPEMGFEGILNAVLSNPAVIEKLMSSPEVANFLGGLVKK